MSKQDLEKHLKGIDVYRQIKCPFCGAPINRYWLDNVTVNDYAYFLAECQTPLREQDDPEKFYENHIFRFAIELPPTIFFDRKEDENFNKTNVWVQRE